MWEEAPILSINNVIMVKNMSGGSKTKSFARKLQHEVPTTALRMPENEFEIVGCVFRMLGNGRMVVRTAHPALHEIQCVIRNKFRGRAKRGHMVTIGSFVLIGLYDWEAPQFKSSDLLHVYTHDNIAFLKSNPALALGSLDSFVSQYVSSTPAGDQDFTFSNVEDDHGRSRGGDADNVKLSRDDLSTYAQEMDFDAI